MASERVRSVELVEGRYAKFAALREAAGRPLPEYVREHEVEQQQLGFAGLGSLERARAVLR
jgi:hypothetical protein